MVYSFSKTSHKQFWIGAIICNSRKRGFDFLLDALLGLVLRTLESCIHQDND
jgi:hypothetical protein